MRSLLLFLALVLAGCYAASLAPDPLGHFAARTDHLHRLEPLGGRILHGAALSFGPLDPEERARPLVYAVYYELHGLPYDWHLALLTHLGQHVGYGLPQIDRALGRGIDDRRGEKGLEPVFRAADPASPRA